MRIMVCVKQVPDPESVFRIDTQGAGYDESGLSFKMNLYDEYAVEEAVRIREKFGDVEITALSVGPQRAEAVVRRAIEFGADYGVHIVTPDGLRLDALETAALIAYYARDKSFDVLVFGVMSEDEQRFQTGPMVAALLDLPCATTVVSEAISDRGFHITVERELDAGRREVIEMPLPAAITVQSGINRPRYPSLSNKLRARRQELEIVTAPGPASPVKCEQLARVYFPPPPRAGVFIEGSIEEQAEKVVRIIHEKTGVL